MAGDQFFWTDGQLEPKRAYRFRCTILSNNIVGTPTSFPAGASYFIKTVQKPGIEISAKEHMYLGHKFYYPGLVTWNPNPIEIKMVDPVTPDASSILTNIIQNSGYVVPATANTLTTIAKRTAVGELGGVKIEQLNENGDTVETWELKNAFIKSVKFGDLDYSKEDLTEITLTIQYDYCVFTDSFGLNTFDPR